MAEEDLESLHETIFWLSQPGIHESINRSAQYLADGNALDAADVYRAR